MWVIDHPMFLDWLSVDVVTYRRLGAARKTAPYRLPGGTPSGRCCQQMDKLCGASGQIFAGGVWSSLRSVSSRLDNRVFVGQPGRVTDGPDAAEPTAIDLTSIDGLVERVVQLGVVSVVNRARLVTDGMQHVVVVLDEHASGSSMMPADSHRV
jgi:hypothetical protein